jgi:hypothetical protein
MIFIIRGLGLRLHKQVFEPYLPPSDCVAIPKSDKFLLVMPIPDQVRDDRSGIQ